ncbi:MAG: radical SAM protein [Polyangiaceae bacterium]|nr:radical SAM protein [Polyangiaceae bacterium]
MKGLIKVGYACNENCTFCHTADIRHMDDTADRIDWKIDRAKRLGYSMVVLSGGEPTMRPELLRWARRIASRGLDLGLVTNGLMLAYPNVTDELISECRLKYVYMSLHGGDAKVHGSVVRADTFSKAMQAIGNLHGRVDDLTINCVVTTANVRHLRGVVDKLLGFPKLCIKFSMTQPKGGGSRAFDIIVPDVEECAERVKDAIEYGQDKRVGDEPRFAHDGIPFCLLPGLEHLYDDLKTHGYATMIEADEDDFVPVDDVAKIQPSEICGDCALAGACPGLYRGYFETRGASALRPVLGKPRANSYNFVPERDIARAPGAPCPIRTDGTTPYDRGRTLFVRMKDRMRLFRTETRDFSDEELFGIKDKYGQLYIDISTKLAPDDFSKDLRKLRLSAECGPCPERSKCTGCYEATSADVFSHDDRFVLDVLAGLSGRVLDLGCGEGRYLETLAKRAETNAIDYVGLDPDPASLSVLGSRYPFARFVTANAEELPDDIGTFDHVLALRSVNHFKDPARVFDGAIARLRPGGTLLLVDNVAFGLVRSRKHASRAESSTTNRLEHFRNDDAEKCARRLEGKPLRLILRHDVTPLTSNQWVLRYERLEQVSQ